MSSDANTDDFSKISTAISVEKSDQSIKFEKLTGKISSYKKNANVLLDVMKEETKRTYLVVERDQNNAGLLRYNQKETFEKFIKGKVTDDLSVRQQLSTIDWSRQFLIDELRKSSTNNDNDYYDTVATTRSNLDDNYQTYEELFDRTEKNQKVYYQFDTETILFTPETNLRTFKPTSITISGTGGSGSSSKETPIRSNDNLINAISKRSYLNDFKDLDSSLDENVHESSVVLKIPDEDILEDLENYLKELTKKTNVSEQLSKSQKSISTYYMQAEGSILKSFKVPIESIKSLKKPDLSIDNRPTSKKWNKIDEDLEPKEPKTSFELSSLNIGQTEPETIAKSINYHSEVINLTLENSVSTMITLGYLSAITPPPSQWVTITSQPEQSVTLIPQERQWITITSQPIQSEEFTLSLSKEKFVTLTLGHWITSTQESEQWIMVTSNPDQLVTIKPQQNQWITIEQKKNAVPMEQMEPVSITLNKTENTTVTLGQLTALPSNPVQWITIRPQSGQSVTVSPKSNQSITITPQVGKADNVTPQPGQWVTIKPPFGQSEAVSIILDQTKPVTLTLGQLTSVEPAPGQWFTIQPQLQIPINVKPKFGQWITVSALPAKLVQDDDKLFNEFPIEPTDFGPKSSTLSQNLIRSGVQSKQLRRSVATNKLEQPKSKEFKRKTAITPPLILSELNTSNVPAMKSRIMSPIIESVESAAEQASEYIEIVSITLSQSQETLLTLGQLTTVKPAPQQWIIVTSKPGQLVKVIPESRVWVTITPQSGQTESMSLTLDDNTKDTTLTLGQISTSNLPEEQWVTVESKRGQSVSIAPKQGQWVTIAPKFEQPEQTLQQQLDPEILSLTLSQTDTVSLTVGQLTSLKPEPKQWVKITPQSGQIVTVHPEPGQSMTITPQQGQADNILLQPEQWVTIKPPSEPSEYISMILDQKQQPVTLTLGYLPSIQSTSGQWFTVQPQLKLPIIVNPQQGQWVTICALNDQTKSVQFKSTPELSLLAPKSEDLSKKLILRLRIQSKKSTISTTKSLKSECRSPSGKTLPFTASETNVLSTQSKFQEQSIPPPILEYTELVSLTLDQTQETALTVGQLTNVQPIPEQWIIASSQPGQLVKIVPQSKRWITITPQPNQTESMSLTLNQFEATTLTLGQISNLPTEHWVAVESKHGQSVTITSKPGQWVTIEPKSKQATRKYQNFETINLTLGQTETTTLTVGQLASITPAPEQWFNITPQSGQTVTVQPKFGQSMTITPPQGQAEGIYPQPGHWATIKPPMGQSEAITINMENFSTVSAVTFGQLASIRPVPGQWLTVQPKPGQSVMIAPQIGQWVTVAPTLDLPANVDTKMEKVELMLGEVEAFTYTLEACSDNENVAPKSNPKITITKSRNYLKLNSMKEPLIKHSLPQLFSKKETMIKYRTLRKGKVIESPKSLDDEKTQSRERPKQQQQQQQSTLKVERRITIASKSPMRKLIIPKQLLDNAGADETSSLEQFRENIFSVKSSKETIKSTKESQNIEKAKSMQPSSTKSIQLQSVSNPKESLPLGQLTVTKPEPKQAILVESHPVTVTSTERQSVKADSKQPQETTVKIVPLPRYNQSKQILVQSSDSNLPQSTITRSEEKASNEFERSKTTEKSIQNKKIKKQLNKLIESFKKFVAEIHPLLAKLKQLSTDSETTNLIEQLQTSIANPNQMQINQMDQIEDNLNNIKNLKHRQELSELKQLKNRLIQLKKETDNLEQKKFQELELELAINQKQREMIEEQKKLIRQRELEQSTTSLLNGRSAIVLASIVAIILFIKFLLPLIYF